MPYRSPLVLLLALLLLITGCQSGYSLSSDHPILAGGYNLLGSPLPQSSKYYLSQADAANEQTRYHYQLLAAQKLLQDGDRVSAGTLLDALNNTWLDDDNKTLTHILLARIALLDSESSLAIKTLLEVYPKSSSPAQLQMDYHQVLAIAYRRQNQIIPYLVQQHLLANLSTDRLEQAQVHHATWQTLTDMPIPKLKRLQQQTQNKTARGWLNLADIANSYANQPSRLSTKTNEWKHNYPNHPATQTIVPQFISPSSNKVRHIALLLPLSGAHKQEGQAIREGFLAAHYKHPTSHIEVYDTSSQSVTTLYDQAIHDGADFIVGPLEKKNVESLLNHAPLPNVPILALNYNSRIRERNGNWYQFGLSPEDDTRQIAERAWQNGHDRIAIIAPKGKWGEKVVHTFESHWQMLGGHIAEKLFYPPPPEQNLSASIKKLLKVDESEQRHKSINALLSAKQWRVNSTPRRRQDLDAIFYVAQPNDARQIKPQLNFYFAGNLATYTTIQSFSKNPSIDKDLNGSYLCAPPWVLSTQAPEQRELASRWHDRYANYESFYALGADAHLLTQTIERVTSLQNLPLKGATGQLRFIEAERKIQRQCAWAKIKDGRTILLT